MSAATLLLEAADLADGAKTWKNRIQLPWGRLHAEGAETMMDAFDAWKAAEDFQGWAGNLGGILRRRYKDDPEGIGRSLRRAASLLGS